MGIATIRQHGFVGTCTDQCASLFCLPPILQSLDKVARSWAPGMAHAGRGDSGVLRTVPIASSSFQVGQVRVNYRNTSAVGGSIRVAVLEQHPQHETATETDSDAETLWRVQPGRAATECVPLRGDEVAGFVSWSTGDRVLASVAPSVALEFVLDGDVELFSFSLH